MFSWIPSLGALQAAMIGLSSTRSDSFFENLIKQQAMKLIELFRGKWPEAKAVSGGSPVSCA